MNGICGPAGPDAPELVVLELKHEHDLKEGKKNTVEYVQDQQGNREIVIRGLAQVASFGMTSNGLVILHLSQCRLNVDIVCVFLVNEQDSFTLALAASNTTTESKRLPAIWNAEKCAPIYHGAFHLNRRRIINASCPKTIGKQLEHTGILLATGHIMILCIMKRLNDSSKKLTPC